MTIIPSSTNLREAARLSRETFRIVLASQSPRRRQLLHDSGFRFDVLPAREGAETLDAQSPLDPTSLVLTFARKKAADVVEQLRARGDRAKSRATLVLACDSVAECQGETLGKPRDREDAERMLRTLSGSIHYVRTGVAIVPVDDEDEQRLQPFFFVESSALIMERLSEERLVGYLDSGLWRGKAGAFGYQDGNDWLKLLGGSESNVVGLPLEAVALAVMRYADDLSNPGQVSL